MLINWAAASSYMIPDYKKWVSNMFRLNVMLKIRGGAHVQVKEW